MKSLRCKLGLHREFAVEGFPAGANSPLIVGVECERCRRVRCVGTRIPHFREDAHATFAEAKTWLEKVTGRRVIGAFVEIR
jgi:hypothetical protein